MLAERLLAPRPAESQAVGTSAEENHGSVRLRITCPTEGASIAYTTKTGDDAHWELYGGESELTEPASLRARAIRMGYRGSPETRADFTVAT